MTTLPIRVVARLLLAPAWVVALALLLEAHEGTGDGFSAGLLVSLAVLMQALVGGPEAAARVLPRRAARAMLAAGLLLVLAVVFGPTFLGQPPLTHYPRGGAEPPGLGHVALDSGFALDVGVFLLVVGVVASLAYGFAGLARRVRGGEAPP